MEREREREGEGKGREKKKKDGKKDQQEKQKKKTRFFFLFFTFLHCFLLLCRSHSCSIFHLTWPFSIRFSLIFFVYSFTHFLLHASIRIVALYIHTPEKSLWTSPEHLSHKCPALICANRAGPFMTLGTLPDWFFFQPSKLRQFLYTLALFCPTPGSLNSLFTFCSNVWLNSRSFFKKLQMKGCFF